MYDTDKKLIFTHPHKCGGTSIEGMLGFLELRKQQPLIASTKHASLEHHLTILSEQGINVEEFFKFSIIRNPWARSVSFYNHSKYKEYAYYVRQGKEHELPIYIKDARRMTFKEFVLKYYKEKFHSKRRTIPYMCVDGKFCLDYVIRLENFKEDLYNIKDRLQVDLTMSLPHLNNSDVFVDREHYSEYYDNETKDIINNLFEWDIKRFNYKFEQ